MNANRGTALRSVMLGDPCLREPRSSATAKRARNRNLRRRRLLLESLDPRLCLAVTYASTDVPKTIDELNPTVVSQLTIPDNGVITDVNIQFDIDHTWNSDLIATLESPEGTRVILFSGVGGDGDNFEQTILDDDDPTAIPITSGSPPFSGTFLPQNPLSTFDLQQLSGTWTLEIEDTFPSEDDGFLNSWSLSVEAFDGGIDYGDAPPTYPTLTNANGAAHVAQGPILGQNRDSENDGFPSPLAGGDDLDARNDEDGVVFDDYRPGQIDAEMTVHVSDAPTGAKLDAWIDFDHDGTWSGPAEQIASALNVTNGDNVVRFDIPAWTPGGLTIARFRLSTAGGLTPYGTATDGEVEDHALTIGTQPELPGSFSAEIDVSSVDATDRSEFVQTADVNGDGFTDIVTVGRFDARVYWHQNDGSNQFTSRNLVTDLVNGPMFAWPVDLDDDSDVDVIAGSIFETNLAWYRNDGSENFTEVVFDASETEQVFSVFPVDIDADGDLDVLASTTEDGILLFRNSGSNTWTREELQFTFDPTFDSTNSVFPTDLDGDGDLDVLFTVFDTDTLIWLENNGDGTISSFENVVSSTGFAIDTTAADLDGDGLTDIVASFTDRIAWFRNDGLGFNPFSEQPLPGTLTNIGQVLTADIDDDGDIDIVAASSSNDTIAAYTNDGSGSFTYSAINTNATDVSAIFAGDVDLDGDIDLVAGTTDETKGVFWLENQNTLDTGSLSYDFGDAPPPYQTLSADDGPRHVTGSGVHMGSAPDSESDAPNPQGTTTDDQVGIDDEDGVTFTSDVVIGQSAAFDVVTSSPGILAWWIDADGNGVPDAPSEVFSAEIDSAGTHSLTFDVPFSPTSALGTSLARFRYATHASDVAVFTGFAADGEVEDYLVDIVAPSTIVVTTGIDENDGTIDPSIGTGTSLREAIVAANANSDANTIVFDPSVDIVVLDSGLPAPGQQRGAYSRQRDRPHRPARECFWLEFGFIECLQPGGLVDQRSGDRSHWQHRDFRPWQPGCSAGGVCRKF